MIQGRSVRENQTARAMKIGCGAMRRSARNSIAENDSGHPSRKKENAGTETQSQTSDRVRNSRVFGRPTTCRVIEPPPATISMSFSPRATSAIKCTSVLNLSQAEICGLRRTGAVLLNSRFVLDLEIKFYLSSSGLCVRPFLRVRRGEHGERKNAPDRGPRVYAMSSISSWVVF
jgi:hypothetical protein